MHIVLFRTGDLPVGTLFPHCGRGGRSPAIRYRSQRPLGRGRLWDPCALPRMGGPRMSRQFDAIVIGSGLGGLTAAALYAQAGNRVLVLERNRNFGGAATVYRPR